VGISTELLFAVLALALVPVFELLVATLAG